MKKVLLLLLPACLLITSCGLLDNYGKKVMTNDKSTVYYKGDGVTEMDAKKLGDYLIKQEYFDTKTDKAVQISNDSGYIIRFVVDKQKLDKNKEALFTFWNMQRQISDDVFNGKKVKIILANDKLKDIQDVGSIAKLNVKDKSTIYYNDAAFQKPEMQKLGDLLVQQGYFGGENEKEIYVTKEGGENMVRFIVNREAVEKNAAAFMPVYEYMQYLIKDSVFNGKTTKMLLTSVQFEDFKTVPEITEEQKNKIELQLKQVQEPAVQQH